MTNQQYRKARRDPPPNFYAAEAAGLRWLAESGAPVVAVREVGDDFIALQRLEHAAPAADAALTLGADLARMHAAGAPQFGSPPAGFSGQQYIGNQMLSSVTHPTWGAFYAAERVLPFARKARAVGSLSATDAAVVEEVCIAIAGGAFDDDAAPARIHGDLWNGNVVWTPTGAVLIDPAAHGGHHETDLAMLALFGVPHFTEIIDGYQSQRPLRSGWRQRLPLHQLHPLAVHAASHGPAYGAELRRAADAVREL